MPSRHKYLRHHLDRKLRFRLYLYLVIAAALLVFISYEILSGLLTFLLASVAIACGVGIGIILAHTHTYAWNRDMNKIVAQLDWLGAVILGIYFIFSLNREHILSNFVHGATVFPVGLSVTAGVMLGRLFGMQRKIVKILAEQKLV